MTLLNTKFEQEEGTTVVPTPTPAAEVSVVSTNTAVAPISSVESDVIASLKNTMKVEYNTLAQVKCTNGNFMEREANKVLGDTIVFELLSWQDGYVITANDDKAPKDLLRFSDDGITCKDGETVADHLFFLKEQGYTKAGVKHRLTVVGAVQSCSKTADFNGVLVQFDLSPESRVLFQRYQATCAYGVRKGVLDPKKVLTVKASARVVTKGSNSYTVSDFVVA
jgi:hypothetical protein